MKKINIIFIFFLVCSCKGSEPKEVSGFEKVEIPKTFLLKSSINIAKSNDTTFVDNKKYSGFLYQLYPNHQDTIFIEGYSDGLLSGTLIRWYENRQVMEQRTYQRGRKHGKQVSFWENGNKRFEFIAENDVYVGELKEWNNDARLVHLANFVNGQEEGTQQMWYDNGKIKANYVIIKGKRYGLLGTKNCRNVSDSLFIVR